MYDVTSQYFKANTDLFYKGPSKNPKHSAPKTVTQKIPTPPKTVTQKILYPPKTVTQKIPTPPKTVTQKIPTPPKAETNPKPVFGKQEDLSSTTAYSSLDHV